MHRGRHQRRTQDERVQARMNAEADRMGRLVDELLTPARLDRQPELRMNPVDLSRLVRDGADDLRAQQPRRPLTVRAGGALIVHGDESGLRQVVGNLLSNIRAHTPVEAAVRVELTRTETADRGPWVRLEIADDGPGMSAKDAERIFDRFFRAAGGGSADGPVGSGLGMAIVQALVAAQGGTVTVRTAPGEGLAVTVGLLARPAGDPRPAVTPAGRV
ncbi:sensor histidine kinase [Streptomyces sp. NPDC058572]|uniref:sensor histidine kinase n=1 Tax=Streptomyces sp. NPDC058572 TaxID=3346546 RepID=UPI003657B095